MCKFKRRVCLRFGGQRGSLKCLRMAEFGFRKIFLDTCNLAEDIFTLEGSWNKNKGFLEKSDTFPVYPHTLDF